MSAPATLRTFDGAEWELRATTQTGTALYAVKGAPKCCPPYVMATLTELAEHGIQSTELAAAVAELGALPVPVGSERLSPEERGMILGLIGDAKPATSGLLVSFGESVQNRREHEHPTWEDLYCMNLSSYMGERMAPVLRRLVDVEAENERLRARDVEPDAKALAKRDGAILRQAAEELKAACPEHSDADEVWMDCPCEYVEELLRKAQLAEARSTS
ncbi:hypothetical protein PV735_11190 [Streptomyces turgidiscabies]|uniref:Uncharacterized protein n=1 Tax=Streptomyces turgidiscabies (strain Car8) TaxID=698760 RepID=L7EVT1_STRT8|nr:hypothetical protein [Streptomyces turgidiscabies]ELP62816.1 hypothetical protein STRTUCAR8_06417 [Streptomyces turgidiscabies Car8]MDX3493248.1 hypothetical protein [Streptomyces turgidiscabies]GAQ70548.1 hypothetical protein T45_02284 [Streptomyces turgidiscabies]